MEGGWNFSPPCGRRGPGRPPIVKDVEDLIVRVARENRSWGYDRIAGALANLAHEVSDGLSEDQSASQNVKRCAGRVLQEARLYSRRAHKRGQAIVMCLVLGLSCPNPSAQRLALGDCSFRTTPPAIASPGFWLAQRLSKITARTFAHSPRAAKRIAPSAAPPRLAA